jgi:hypothetical protein
VTKPKMPKAPKPPKAPKQPKAAKSGKVSNSIEVKVRLPLTNVSIMSVLLAALLTLVGYAGYLGVNSIWKFTHPQFNVSLDSLRALPYIASGTEIPPFPILPFPADRTPTTSVQVAYLQAVGEFKEEFRRDFPKSRLLNISDNEFLNMGVAFCETKNESITKTGKFAVEEIISAYQAKFVLRYPGMNGLDQFIAGIGQRALDNLCRSS